jgi:hypothetical protein
MLSCYDVVIFLVDRKAPVNSSVAAVTDTILPPNPKAEVLLPAPAKVFLAIFKSFNSVQEVPFQDSVSPTAAVVIPPNPKAVVFVPLDHIEKRGLFYAIRALVIKACL